MPLSKDLLTSSNVRDVRKYITNFFHEAVSINAQNPATPHQKVAETLLDKVVVNIALANNRKPKNKILGKIEEEFSKVANLRANRGEKKSEEVILVADNLLRNASQHRFTPALTSHPTNPKATEIDNILVKIYDLSMIVRNCHAAQNSRIEEKNDHHVGHNDLSDKLKKASEKLASISGAQDITPQNVIEKSEEYIANLMRGLCEINLQPAQKMTVKEEVDRNLQNFESLFNLFPRVRDKMFREFYDAKIVGHSISNSAVEEVRKKLFAATQKQFQDIYFWSASDADGNINITAQTMEDAIKSHQQKLDELYTSRIDRIISDLNEDDKKINDALVRVEDAKYDIDAISNKVATRVTKIAHQIGQNISDLQAASDKNADRRIANDVTKSVLESVKRDIVALRTVGSLGIVINEESSKNAADGICKKIDALHGGDSHLSEKQRREITDLGDLINTFGFIGAKMDVRQSSVENKKVLNNILQIILKSGFAEELSPIGSSDYSELSPQEKDKFHNLINDPRMTELLVEKFNSREGFDEVSIREINRIALAKKYPDIFKRYIISDCEDITSIREIRFLEKLGQKISYPRSVTGEVPTPLEVYPLCETRRDIENLPLMIGNTLSTKENIAILNGKLTLFAGYSDIEKRCGIGGLALIQKKMAEAFEVIENAKKAHPDWFPADFEVVVFHGQGNDLIRQGEKQVKLSTFQGQGATDFQYQQRAKNFIENVSGHEDDFIAQVAEIRDIKPQELKDEFQKFIQISVDYFEEFVRHDEKSSGDKIAQLLRATVIRDAVEKTNVSSRAKAKGANAASAMNLDSERAIGLATYFSASGTQANVWYGFSSNEFNADSLSALFSETTVAQDIAYKTAYSLAITDFDRARKSAQINGEKIDEDFFASLEKSAVQALRNVVCAATKDKNLKEKLLIEIEDNLNGNKSIGDISENIMTKLGGNFAKLANAANDVKSTHHATVNSLLDEYQRNQNPSDRARITSDLAVIYREEMRVPQIIEDLVSTKTKPIEATRLSEDRKLVARL